MSRRPNREAVDQRAIADRYGIAQRHRLYKRIATGRPFGLFLIDGRLSFADYPSVRCSGLQQDCAPAMVGIYSEMPTFAQLVEDLQATEATLASEATAS